MIQNKVVLISENASSFISLLENLKINGMDAYTVSPFEDIFEKYLSLPFVLTIVDTDSFGQDTLKLVSYLRGTNPAPIIVMMTESCLCNRLELLRMGATICMDAEASPEEQAAQVKALIQIYSAKDDSPHRETLFFGTALVINPVYRIVILNGKRIKLTRREFDLLYLMARQDNRVFTSEQIYRHLWSNEDDAQIGDTIKSSIKALRKKLKPAGHDYIQNVWGTGYRFVGNPDKI